jgi:hypothetical protein
MSICWLLSWRFGSLAEVREQIGIRHPLYSSHGHATATPTAVGPTQADLESTRRGRVTMYPIASAMSSAASGSMPDTNCWRASSRIWLASWVATGPGSITETRACRQVTSCRSDLLNEGDHAVFFGALS